MVKKIVQSKVRLSNDDLNSIKNCFNKNFSNKDSLWIFGSRVEPTQKGGDIDLYIETYETNFDKIVKRKIQFISDLWDNIGEQKIDVVINVLAKSQNLPVYEIAKTTGIKIK